MSSADDFSCDFCRKNKLAAIYKPDGSTRGLTVYVCERCGLVQSAPRIARTADRHAAAVSGGADWGNVRYGKGFRTGAAMEAIAHHADLSGTPALLDVGSNRGSFVKAFLEAPRKDALKILQDAWMESTSFNELKLMPGILCEGEWTNQPQETREFLLNLIDAIPEGKWWSLNAFIRDIKLKYADFQRPAGDYDSWFIKRASDGQYLRGFSYWDQVDGALIKYFITNILHDLGQVDLSIAEGATEPLLFGFQRSQT